MDKKKTLESFDAIISGLDGAVGRMIVTAMSGNAEVKEAMEMVSNASVSLGMMAEEFEEIFQESEEDPDLDWEAAEKYLGEMIEAYEEIGRSGSMGLAMILLPLKDRLKSGERTKYLYDAIMECE